MISVLLSGVVGSIGGGGCAGEESRAVEDRPGEEHSGPIYANDMAARNEGFTDPDGVLAGGGAPAPSACYGEVESGLFTCDDTRCDGVASCRVGNSRLCSAPIRTALDLTGCEASPLSAACLGLDVMVFGNPAPWVTSSGLHPNGAAFDSGVMLSERLGLRSHRATLAGTFRAPACIDGEPCLETVSFGVTTQSTLGSRSHVSPLLALRYVAERGEVQLVSGDVVLARSALIADDPYTLELLPEGRAVASNGSGVFATVAFTPADDARVVLFGRNVNHGAPAPEGARIEAFSVAVGLCDVPDAWGARSPLTVVDASSGETSFEGLGGIATAIVGSETVVAFHARADDGLSRIFAATRSEAGATALVLVNEDRPILEGTFEHELGGVRDPELHVDGAVAHLYYTALSADGVASIGHAAGANLKALDATAEPVLDPGSWSDLADLAEPTIAAAYDGRLVMVVNATLESGAQALVAFTATSADGPFARVVGSPLETLTLRTGSPQAPVFDSEEISSPALENVGGAFHLYYLGRRGTRRGLGMYATDDFAHFRHVSEEPLFVAGTNGLFDSLGPTSADVLVEASTVSLCYVGTDGVTDTMGWSTRDSFVESW